MCMYTVRSYSEDTYTYLNTMTLIETCIAILFLSLLEIYHPSRIDFFEGLGLESQVWRVTMQSCGTLLNKFAESKIQNGRLGVSSEWMMMLMMMMMTMVWGLGLGFR